MAANTGVAGLWRGRQIGLISFAASAAKYKGAEIDGCKVSHRGRGLRNEGNRTRRIPAFRDACDFPSSQRVFARELGSWPVLLVGTFADMSMAWIMND